MSKKLSFRQRFAQFFMIPQDLICKEPMVTMLGRQWVRIENYENLVEYQTDKIVVRVSGRKLEVLGTGLEIISYTNDEMYITGEIVGVSYSG